MVECLDSGNMMESLHIQYLYEFNKRKQSPQWFVHSLIQFARPALINCPDITPQSSELRYTANTQLEHRKLPDFVTANILISSFSTRSLYWHW